MSTVPSPVRQFVAVRRQFVNEVGVGEFVSSSVRSIGTNNEHELLTGGERGGLVGVRCNEVTPGRQQRRRQADTLRSEIAQVCLQIDRRLHNPPGTAERGLYFWYWPPVPSLGADTLAALRADAVEFLAALSEHRR